MKRQLITGAVLLIVAVGMLPTRGRAANEPDAALTSEAIVPLSDVAGRIDHMALDPGRQHLFVAALGNNTVEVVDIASGKRQRRIGGLDEPQGIGYAEKADLLFVANAGDGSVRVFQAANYRLSDGSISRTMRTTFASIRAPETWLLDTGTAGWPSSSR